MSDPTGQEREALEMYADRIEADRKEPDKILCHIQSMRSAALAVREEPCDQCLYCPEHVAAREEVPS